MWNYWEKLHTETHIPVNAFLPPPEDPAGTTFKTLNLTVFDNGLQKI